jgi:RNA polymerase sigma factor (sigma-70 family)
MKPLEPLTHRSPTCSDNALSAFLVMRPRLYGIVYRMLRSSADAEDILQDVWVRWQTADRSLVRDSAAFLVTTARRLAINAKQSAHSRHEAAFGSSLPERSDTSTDPLLNAERRQALARGILSLLERLAPTERAAYLLREAFDYSYRDIANALQLEEANARQVVTRARQHIANARTTPATSGEQKCLLEAFLAAATTGDIDGFRWTLGVMGRRHVAMPQRVSTVTASADDSATRFLAVAV